MMIINHHHHHHDGSPRQGRTQHAGLTVLETWGSTARYSHADDDDDDQEEGDDENDDDIAEAVKLKKHINMYCVNWHLDIMCLLQ